MKHKSKTAREMAGGKPCVVLDQDEKGDIQVFADEGVVVLNRSSHLEHDCLFRYTQRSIQAFGLKKLPDFLVTDRWPRNDYGAF